MACLVQNSASTVAHLPVHENLGKKRKLTQSNGFKKQRVHDGGSPTSWSPLYPGTRLDQDTIQYIHKFYCKDCQMDQQAAERAKAAAAAGTAGEGAGGDEGGGASDVKVEPLSPISPQQTTDDTSITHGMDKNKESLKRKLMMRRSLHELVDQGIYPPPKTPPAFMEQRKSLERAKTGDLLRYKIQHRPDRQQLVQQHILEDTTIDPSLHERQRLLKRAKLTDNLNDKLLHRPGVLELVQSNIFQTDDTLKELIREGSLSFEKTFDDADDDSTAFPFDDKSSDDAPSPDQTDDSNMSDISSPPPPPDLPTSFAKSLPFSAQIQFSQASKVTLPQSFSIPQNTTSVVSGQGHASSSLSPKNNSLAFSNSNNNNKSRPKKPKPKTQPKAKVIKFHEYKGPPNVVKTQPVLQGLNAHSDTPYHILLQQQQLFLQWQLEFNQKNLNLPLLLPAQKGDSSSCSSSPQPVGQPVPSSSAMSSPGAGPSSVTVTSTVESTPVTVSSHPPAQTVFTMTTPQSMSQPQIKQIHITTPAQLKQDAPAVVAQPQPQLTPPVSLPVKQAVKKQPPSSSPAPPKQFSNLEEMKVAELKAELRKRGLIVSGAKPQLIERLKPYADVIIKPSSDKSQTEATNTSPTVSVMSPSSSMSSLASSMPPQFSSVTSPPVSVFSPVMSPQGPQVVLPPPTSSIGGSQAVSLLSSSSSLVSRPNSVQTVLTSPPGSVHSVGSVRSPQGSVLSRQDSVMSPQESVIDEVLPTNALSPLSSIQAIQSAVSVTNMMPEDITCVFSPPPSPSFMDSVINPLSPDIMDLHIASPPDLSASQTNKPPLSASQSSIPMAVDQSRPPSVAPSEPGKIDTAPMDIDAELGQSLNLALAQPPPAALPQTSAALNANFLTATNQQKQIQLLQQMQNQLLQHQQLQLQQQQQQQQQLQQQQQQQQQHQQQQQPPQPQQKQSPLVSTQLSHEELLRQQQQTIEELQSQLEESQRKLELQQMQHQQLHQQQQQLQKLQQQQLQQQQQAQQQQRQQQQQQKQQQQQQQKQQQLQQQHQQQQLQQQQQQLQQQQQQQKQQQQQQVSPPPPPLPPVPSQPVTGQTQTIQNPTSPPQVFISVPNGGKTAPQSTQNPASPQQVFISVPNGGKTPPLPVNLQNTKQIQIPAHLLQAVQNSQGLPTVIVTQNAKADTSKPSLNDFFKNQAINQTLNLGGKSILSVSTAPAGLQQFIITTTAAKTSQNPVNGLTQARATSLPGSPVENQRPVSRTASNPFFIPLKEPPKYDEVVKNRQQQQQQQKQQKSAPGGLGDISTSMGQTGPMKNQQTIDDVLELLISRGELPPSAAQEPPPTPKSVAQPPTMPAVSVSMAGSRLGTSEMAASSIGNGLFSQAEMFSLANVSTATTTVTTTLPKVSDLASYSVNSSQPLVKMEPTSPPTSVLVQAPPVSDTSANDFFDISDVIANDLNSMDWTSDSAFGNLDLTDTTNLNTDIDMKFSLQNENSLLSVPMGSSPHKSVHGSEPDLNVLGLGEGDTNSHMQIDVPDWLDVIMPSTGLTPLSANAPVSFPSDPILTPRTQQEVLDLFNFDESDLNTPSDLTSGTHWEKLTETSTT